MAATESPVLAVDPGDFSVKEFEARPQPVRYLILDRATPVRWKPFPPDWSGWEARYDNDTERGKRTVRNLNLLSWDIVLLHNLLTSAPLVAAIAETFGFDHEQFIPDPTMHGGGIHVTAPGGWLNCHLDYDQHPHMPDCRRAVNLIAFLHEEWRSEWGGQFYLADRLGKPQVVIDPVPGRIIMFETSDASYHGVAEVTGPADRVSLALYYLAPSGPCHSRLRALFMPTRGKR